MTVNGNLFFLLGCYTACLGNPLWIWERYDEEIPCSKIGLIPVLNSYVLPPEGIAFEKNGMLGQAWIDTPLGVFDEESKSSRHWSLILDTDNLKGPIAYFLPEFWAQTGKWANYDGQMYPTSDFSKTGMKTGGGAFEWHTIPVLGKKSSSGDVFVKIPKMQMGKNQGDKTVLMSGFKSWHSSEDLYSMVDDLMSGTVAG